MTSASKKGGMSDVIAAIRDFIIVVLLMVASAGGGYWVGVHEKFAPVEYVPASTPGAVVPAASKTGTAGNATAPASEQKK